MNTDEITRDFFDKQLYAIYKGVWENWGEDAWKIVWRTGELVFDEIEPELHLAGTTWIEGMQRLGAYLAKVGYVRGISVKQITEDRMEYSMNDPAIMSCAKRLVAIRAAPPHVSTALMFAMLKKVYGLGAEMLGDPDLRDDGFAVEQWQVFPLKQGINA
jgi:hypothetical protein